MTIGDNIKKIRKEKKLTQQQLAKKMGISRSYLSDVENNRYNPSSKTIESFAEKLGVSMLYLTTGRKTLKDLSDKEKESFYQDIQGIQHTFKKHKKYMQLEIKNEIEQLLESELSIVEATYLIKMVHFLKIADTQDIIGISSIIATLIKSVEYKNNEETNKEELRQFLENEMNYIMNFFRDFLFRNGD